MLVLFTSIIKSLTASEAVEKFKNNNPRFRPNAFGIILLIILLLTGLTTVISTVIVAYRCNHRENMFIKVCIVLFALFFSEFYVPYYLIKYVILGRKCGDNVFIRTYRT